MTKLAIVHEFLLSYGGAERVLEHVHEMYPDAPVFTLRHNPKMIHHRMDGWDIRPSLIERLPLFKKRGHTLGMPLYPLAVEDWDFSGFDVVLSLSSAFAHGVITQPGTTHICYYHTPARFLWDYHFQYLKEKGWDRGVRGAMAQRFLHRLREWDFLAAQRPDVVLANSRTVQARISKFYRRESEVLYPGIDVSSFKFQVSSPQDYYITVCRLTPAKRIELAVEACTKLKRELHVIGAGDELANLQKIAGPTIKFLGFVSDEIRLKEMQGCRALIWPNIDDFGLVPVEVMSMGRPVVAYNVGGATETVEHGKTGVLFDDQTTHGLVKAIEEFEKLEHSLSAEAIAHHAATFSKEAFQKQLRSVIEKKSL